MGIDEISSEEFEESLNIARRVAIFNSEVIFNAKNSLLMMTEQSLKNLKEKHEKFSIIIKNSYPNCIIENVLANVTNKDNHDASKYEVDLIQEEFIKSKNGI